MYNFSLLVDDSIAASLETKLQVCHELHISNLELEDDLEEMSISQMNGKQLEAIRELLIDHHVRIVLLIGSKPASDYEYYKRLFAKAHMLNVENVKVQVGGKDAEGDALAWVGHLQRILSVAQSFGIRMVIENHAETVLSSDHLIAGIYKQIRTEWTGVIFNPLEYVRTKSHPFFHEFYSSKLKGQICFLRIQDGLFRDGSAVWPGEGDAELKEMASILLKRSYQGYFSFTPYLEKMDATRYLPMLERFKRMLKEL